VLSHGRELKGGDNAEGEKNDKAHNPQFLRPATFVGF
jgi:hypothetical protein